ncbi:MAG: GTPase Era [Deltaproteobacteria bacterium]|nr:GTPase Era [Deltaproteobacteria bacterium]
MNEKPFHSGYVAIAGRPNAGKSTLLNRLLEQPLSLVTAKPQTTRQRILGICNVEPSEELPGGAQILFIDTPGLHKPTQPLNRFLVREALSGIEDSDLILYLLDGPRGVTEDDRFAFGELKKRKQPKYLVINKVDLIKPKDRLLPFIEELSALGLFDEIIPISARKDAGFTRLKTLVARQMPPGEPYYPADQVTDRDTRFVTSESIRGALFRRLGKELPYSVAVEVTDYHESRKLDRIRAVIYVERDSQKRIVIGEKGSMVKEVGTEARKYLEKLLGKKVFLELEVKVLKDWTSDPRALKRLGYHQGG